MLVARRGAPVPVSARNTDTDVVVAPSGTYAKIHGFAIRSAHRSEVVVKHVSAAAVTTTLYTGAIEGTVAPEALQAIHLRGGDKLTVATDQAPVTIYPSYDIEVANDQAEYHLKMPVISGSINVTRNAVVRIPWDATLAAASYLPDGTQNGADTNTRTLQVVNLGATGAGTTVMASKALTAGINLGTAFDEYPLTLSATPANLLATSGDLVSFRSLHVSAGLADPGGTGYMKFTRR